MHIRRTLATAAVSAIALGGVAVAPAQADETTDCAATEAALVAAKADRDAAKGAFVTYRNTPLGELVRAERREARVEARQSARALRSLEKDVRKAERRTRRQVARELRVERRELAKAERQLGSRRALLADVVATRKELKAEWAASQVALRQARRAHRECLNALEETTSEEPTTEEPTTEGVES
jgi:hypothetical protein